jgi:cytochrome b
MRQHLVYDWPTRLFHWTFAGLFLTAFFIAKNIEDDSPVYAYHMLAGLTVGFVVLIRTFWGLVGTKHAKFSDFALNPHDLLSYFKGIFTGEKRRWAGHNPASSWAAIAMMLMALGLATTGYLMTSGPNKEDFEDIHELFANGLMVVVIFHVVGVVVHTIRHREMIGLSMIDGKKSDVSSQETIPSSRPGMGFVFIALVFAFGILLFHNYDSANQNLSLFGSSLELGEGEGQGEGNGVESGEQGEAHKRSDEEHENEDHK